MPMGERNLPGTITVGENPVASRLDINAGRTLMMMSPSPPSQPLCVDSHGRSITLRRDGAVRGLYHDVARAMIASPKQSVAA